LEDVVARRSLGYQTYGFQRSSQELRQLVDNFNPLLANSQNAVSAISSVLDELDIHFNDQVESAL
jgi:hypothetical protein